MREVDQTALATCRICGTRGDFALFHTREMLHGTRQPFDYFECASCGCVRITDVPDDLSLFYPDNYFSFRNHRSLDHNLSPDTSSILEGSDRVSADATALAR